MLCAVAPHCPPLQRRRAAGCRRAPCVRSIPPRHVFEHHEGSPSSRIDTATEKSESINKEFSDIFIKSSGRGEMTVRRALQKKPVHETETQRQIISSLRGLTLTLWHVYTHVYLSHDSTMTTFAFVGVCDSVVTDSQKLLGEYWIRQIATLQWAVHWRWKWMIFYEPQKGINCVIFIFTKSRNPKKVQHVPHIAIVKYAKLSEINEF